MRSVRISGILETIGRVHVGSGNAEANFEGSESVLIRIKMGNIDLPYIPGSSLKGIFRSSIEFILKSLGIYTCMLARRSSCSEISKEISYATRDKNVEKIRHEINNLCIACKIFGGLSYSSNVTLYDCIPIDLAAVKFDTAPGIAINRIDGTTMGGGIFTVEHINPGSFFNFQIKIDNLPNYLIGLLFNVIYLINKNVILIGGKKRAGLGQVKILIDKIEVKKLEDSDVIDYKSLIDHPSETFKISSISGGNGVDRDVIFNLTELKQKSREEFSQALINNFMEVWSKFVETKKN